ncbi:MAG TPA: UPF0175 family protein [Phycisphaerales bacterium]|nr:UPF0175 family protein [Phycisphaerales bacterium]
MTLTIPDEVLQTSGLSERELLIEIACRLYDAEKLDKTPACRLCGLSRVEFEDELHKRKLPLYHLSVEDFEQDMKTVEAMRQSDKGRKAG